MYIIVLVESIAFLHPSNCLLTDVVGPEITDIKCGSDLVTLSWSLGYSEEPVKYVVKYRKKVGDSDARWNEIYDIRGEAYTVQDLLPSTIYLLQVVAYTDSTRSAASVEKECKTTRGEDRC